jgi:hypothetical protein
MFDVRPVLSLASRRAKGWGCGSLKGVLGSFVLKGPAYLLAGIRQEVYDVLGAGTKLLKGFSLESCFSAGTIPCSFSF